MHMLHVLHTYVCSLLILDGGRYYYYFVRWDVPSAPSRMEKDFR